MNSESIRVLAISEGRIPSTDIGIIRPFCFLNERHAVEFRYHESINLSDDDLAWCDVVLFQRNCSHSDKLILWKAQSLGLPIIYDLDDNFFSLPLENKHYAYMARLDIQNAFHSFLRAADVVKVGSKELAKWVMPYNKQIIRHSFAVDFNLLSLAKGLETERIQIGYAGSIVHLTDLKFLRNTFKRIIERYENKVQFVFLGFSSKDFALPENSALFLPPIESYATFLRTMSEQPWRFVLAPLKYSVSNNSKTNNKYREYASCGLPGIYSNLSIYSECVTDGVTGLLCEDTEDAWFEAMIRLIEDPELCKRMGENARIHAQHEYSLERISGLWMNDLLEPLLEKKRQPRDESGRRELLRVIEPILREELDLEMNALIGKTRSLLLRFKKRLKSVLMILGLLSIAQKINKKRLERKMIRHMRRA